MPRSIDAVPREALQKLACPSPWLSGMGNFSKRPRTDHRECAKQKNQVDDFYFKNQGPYSSIR
jgi:hypothetical protein